MLGYGILLPTLPYYTERLALGDNLDTDSINFHIGVIGNYKYREFGK
jgi:DHA1 family multidrug resistance protein-like MFS transporter